MGCLLKSGEYRYSQEVLRFEPVFWNMLHSLEKAQSSLKHYKSNVSGREDNLRVVEFNWL